MAFKALLLVMTAAVMIASLAGQAPEAPSFAGTWKADVAKSDFGSLGKPKSFIRTISHDDLRLTIAADFVDEKGRDQTGELRLSLDGEESVNEIGGTQVRGRAHRLGRHIYVETVREVEGVTAVIYELWSLSSAGRTLTVEGAVATAMGDEDLFVVLNRQHR